MLADAKEEEDKNNLKSGTQNPKLKTPNSEEGVPVEDEILVDVDEGDF